MRLRRIMLWTWVAGVKSFCKDYCWQESEGHKRKRQSAEAAHESKALKQQVYDPDRIKGNKIISLIFSNCFPLMVFAECWLMYFHSK